jgi:glycosyltransferase involved in cell wall biosynthesis
MIINIWSTPRTGSNWYSAYILHQHKKLNPIAKRISQYLNHYHLINYHGDSDWFYEYKAGGSYPYYYYDQLKQSIEAKVVFGKRTRNPEEEENYRIELLENHNHTKISLVMHNHVAPMSEKSYNYLFEKADKNIFLYRENTVNQMSSYALAYATQQWKPTNQNITYENIDVAFEVLENLFERIMFWHKLDKTGCDVIKYEDLDFNYDTENMPQKQNAISALEQLSTKTQKIILDYDSRLKEFFYLTGNKFNFSVA